jgi:hypothetical protein
MDKKYDFCGIDRPETPAVKKRQNKEVNRSYKKKLIQRSVIEPV